MSQTPDTGGIENRALAWLKWFLRPFVRTALFPVRMYRRVKRQLGRVRGHLALRSFDVQGLNEHYEYHGAASCEGWVRRAAQNNAQLVAYLSRLARMCIMSDPERAVRLAEEVCRLDPKPFRNYWLAVMRFDAGRINAAASLLENEGLSSLMAREREKANFILGCARLLQGSIDVPVSPVSAPLRNDQTPALLYVASSSLPYHVSGYTTRTHSILTAIKRQGWSVSCVTRPGYPEDRDDCVAEKKSESVIVDGIEYLSLEGPHRRKVPLDQYLEASAQALVSYAQKVQPAIIQAASNYEAALPAMLASRRLGIPFVYEVRGLWEYTAASRRKGWEGTERFDLDRQLESLTAANADHVFTLTNALADELVARGVQRNKISLAPNAVDPGAFRQRPRDAALASELGLTDEQFAIGYIGSLVSYEGLDDLICAFQSLVDGGTEAVLIIVGHGTALPDLKKLARDLGVADRVRFVGRVSPKQVPRYMSVLDVIALPRKPVRVCELVSPLKPLEAMATKVPMVVSSVPALAEMVVHGETALVHRSGDPGDLARVLKVLSENPELRLRLAENAYQHVIRERTWDVVVEGMVGVYRGTLMKQVRV